MCRSTASSYEYRRTATAADRACPSRHGVARARQKKRKQPSTHAPETDGRLPIGSLSHHPSPLARAGGIGLLRPNDAHPPGPIRLINSIPPSVFGHPTHPPRPPARTPTSHFANTRRRTQSCLLTLYEYLLAEPFFILATQNTNTRVEPCSHPSVAYPRLRARSRAIPMVP